MPEAECIHGQTADTCTWCRERREGKASTGGTRASGAQQVLDTPASVEKYRDRYPGDREATFEAYVAVFFTFPAAREFPGGWTKFSRCANAEPTLSREEPRLVERAERIMSDAGYVLDDSNRKRGGGRMWHRLAD